MSDILELIKQVRKLWADVGQLSVYETHRILSDTSITVENVRDACYQVLQSETTIHNRTMIDQVNREYQISKIHKCAHFGDKSTCGNI